MGMAKGSRFQYAVAAVCLLGALLTGCSRDPNVRKQKYLESGQRYFDKGQYREAEIQFENAIQVDSRFADAHYKLALAAMKLQQWPTAYQELSTTIQLQPDQYAAHLDLANLLILGRQFNDAKEHLDLLVAKQPKNLDVYLAWANYCLLYTSSSSGQLLPARVQPQALSGILLDPTMCARRILTDENSFFRRRNRFDGSDRIQARVRGEDSDSSPAGQPETQPAGLGAESQRKRPGRVRCRSSYTGRVGYARSPAVRL